MSLSFGLNVKPKKAAPEPAPPPRPKAKKVSIFDDDDDEDDTEDGGNGTSDGQVQSIEEISEFSLSARPSRPHPAPVSKAAKPSTTTTTKTTTKPRPSNTTRAGTGPPTRKPAPSSGAAGEQYSDLSTLAQTRAIDQQAQAVDPQIYDYDTFHTAQQTVRRARKAAAQHDAVARKPKYIDALVGAAARRKQDLAVAKEKLLQREREAEGGEFEGKEAFVTGAYKAAQEENRRVEEEEMKKREEEEERRRRTGGGMVELYRTMIEGEEVRHREAVEAGALLERGGGGVAEQQAEGEKVKTDAQIAAELREKGVNVHVNDEGQVTDKRQLLSAGLNVAPAGSNSNKDAAEHLKTSSLRNRGSQNQTSHGARGDRQREMRERQTRMLEEQLQVANKRKREEEEEEKRALEEKSKSRKTEGEVQSARERYLARKREAEERKKKGVGAA